ncbi:MAG TPA: UDP-N-acetylglucosamine--N-acetylmuramyl-(pentapeptide) pyrophosphoryl-undecaprenol N-acetylglucosamine transferase [Microbacteriaceae bacterium]|nr:UDP-N-acetylglucosamine--N-acetylmuramyl-(pentapeptide) pyrophosphoryl-undecaprenol N-acetylglucosamine transferase [Microbacteriaceae bacterium]
MSGYLLAGGGTAGHVNPLLASADRIRERDPEARILVLGTAEGLESRLVPGHGYELAVIPKLPFPRRPGGYALRFPFALYGAVRRVRRMLRERRIDVVVGFGGYAAAPAYLASSGARVPIVVHEANARAGWANRLGARRAARVGVAFEGTGLPGARLIGMPLRHEIEELDRGASRAAAARSFGLDPARPILLVTGGSLGARSINTTLVRRAEQITAAGWQVLHIQGGREEIADPHVDGYRLIGYCDRMADALAAADLALARAGAGTVSEFGALGIPAIYVPFPIGNGEQRLNAAGIVAAGGGLLVDDADLTPEWLDRELLPLIADPARVREMARRAASQGTRDGTARLVDLIMEVRPHKAITQEGGNP